MDRRILPHASFYFVKNDNVKKGGLSVAAKCSLFHVRALQLCLLAVCPILKILWCWCWIVAFLDNARLFLIFNACYKFIPHRIIPLTARQVAYLGKTWEYFCPGPSLFPAEGRDGSSRMDEKNWSRCWKEHGLKKIQGKMLKLWQITVVYWRDYYDY